MIVGPEDEDGSLKRLTSPGDMSPRSDYKLLYEEKVKQLENLQGNVKYFRLPIYCDVPGSPCLSKTGPVNGPFFFLKFLLGSYHCERTKGYLAPCLVTAWSPDGLLETPPCWHVTILRI